MNVSPPTQHLRRSTSPFALPLLSLLVLAPSALASVVEASVAVSIGAFPPPEGGAKSEAQAAVQGSGTNFERYAIAEGDEIAFYAVLITGIVYASFGMMANLTTIGIITRNPRWKTTWRHRFPLYLAIQDLLLCLNLLSSLCYVIHTKSFPAKSQCVFQGALEDVLVGLRFMLIASTAVTSYLKVYKDVLIDFGRFDWQFHTVCLVAPVAPLLVFVPMDSYGTAPYWCHVNSSTLGGHVLMTSMNILYTAFGILVALSYWQVTKKIRSDERSLADPSEKGNSNKPPISKRRAQWSNQVVKKMYAYIIAFVLQWIPVIPLQFLILAGADTTLSNCILLICMHLGGPLTLLIYAKQEGFLYFWYKERKRWYDPHAIGDAQVETSLEKGSAKSSSLEGTVAEAAVAEPDTATTTGLPPTELVISPQSLAKELDIFGGTLNSRRSTKTPPPVGKPRDSVVTITRDSVITITCESDGTCSPEPVPWAPGPDPAYSFTIPKPPSRTMRSQRWRPGFPRGHP